MSELQAPKVEEPDHLLLDDKLGGDGLEKPLWNLLSTKFPKYEAFWSEFIWPLTNRIYGDLPGRKAFHLRPEVLERCPGLIWLAQAHYSAFRRYGSLYLRIYRWPFGKIEGSDPDGLLKALLHQDRFADVYTLFIGVDDMISTMASTLVRLRADVGVEALPAQPAEEESLREFEKWLRSGRYKKALEDNRRTGAPVMFHLFHRGSDLKMLLPENVFSEHEKFRGRIARYRNLLHNPHPTQMWKAGQHLVPKPEKLSDYRLWPEMTVADPEALDKDFEPVEMVQAKDFDALSALLNDIWDAFINKMREVAATEKCRQWLARVPKTSDSFVTIDGPTEYLGAATSTVADLPACASAAYNRDERRPGKYGV